MEVIIISKLGDMIRIIEYEINQFVNGTKNLAYNNYDGYLEDGGSIKGKQKKEVTDGQDTKSVD